jgi:hypothetical protein
MTIKIAQSTIYSTDGNVDFRFRPFLTLLRRIRDHFHVRASGTYMAPMEKNGSKALSRLSTSDYPLSH